MANLLGNWVWEGQSTETKPDFAEGARDGQVFKELDTGDSYARIAGAWEGINQGLAFIRAARSGIAVSNSSGIVTTTFSTPFVDDQYTVMLGVSDTGGPPSQIAFARVSSLDNTGFTIITRAANGSLLGNVTVFWVATRIYDP